MFDSAKDPRSNVFFSQWKALWVQREVDEPTVEGSNLAIAKFSKFKFEIEHFFCNCLIVSMN